jgi:uncharacterized membrane protein
MFDFVYQFLEKMGYSHPIHPFTTHIAIGLVVGAFFFAGVAFLFRRQKLAVTARHCIILAFIFALPAVLFGYMDWQHYYNGAWLFPIKIKLTLAGLLLVFLLISILLARKLGPEAKSLLTIYTLCFLIVVVIGYFGGQLVYGGWGSVVPQELQAGAKIFEANCSGCHPHGSNVIVPNLPLRSAPQLTEFNTFVAFIRNPRMPDGSKGMMPPFPPSKISDQEARELYPYIVKVLKDPRRVGVGRAPRS